MKAFEIRGFNPCESLLRHTPEQLRTFIRRMKDLKMNTIIIHYDYGWKRYKDIIIEECEKAGVNIILMVFGPRTFLSYVDWNKKWFAKNEYGVPFFESLECGTALCPHEQGVIEAFEYGAKEWLKSLPPQVHHVHMRAADDIYYCRCEKCKNHPVYDIWQHFVDVFVKSVLETRPDLKFETDIYYKRYCIPSKPESFSKMTNVMFDTFYRHTAYPIGSSEDSFNENLLLYARNDNEPKTESSPNEYYLNKITEWTTEFPGKLYIHENAMKQNLYAVFQHGTYSYLKDMEIYRKLGVQGICYEAFEPGYSNFADMFEILSCAMNGEDVEYTQTELEKEIAKSKMRLFCTDPSFRIEKYISDPFELKNVDLYRRFQLDYNPRLYREYLDFVFENSDRLDLIFTGFSLANWGWKYNGFKFNNLSPEANRMLTIDKLWDFMEDIPLNEDPIKVCKDLIIELAQKVEM